jgi:drug/metabolite transporter (DMT)-like permease
LGNLSDHTRGILLISLTAFLWSTSGLFIKVLTIDAFQISFYRCAIATVTVFLIANFRQVKPKFRFDLISNLCAASYAGILIFFVIATKLTTAANAIFLQFTAPAYLLFLEPLFLKSRFKLKHFATFAVILAGMSLFFLGKLDSGDVKGNMFAIASGFCFALFSLFLKWKKQKHGETNTINNIIVGNALVAIICLPVILDRMAIDGTQVLILIYMGAIQIGVSYMIFNEGIKYISATETMIIATLEAVFNPIWVFIGIGEVPSNFSILGGLIIIAVIIFNTVTANRKDKLLIAE